MNTTNQLAVKTGNVNDDNYGAYMQRMQARFEANVANGQVPVFRTNAKGLWDLYLAAVPEAERQYHNCHCCRHFIEQYGGLAIVQADGSLASAFWNPDDAEGVEKAPAAALAKAVSSASITGVFLSELPHLGNAVTGVWRHLALTQPEAMRWKHSIDTAHQAAAKKTTEFETVLLALDEFSKSVVEQALTLLRAETLTRGEAVLGGVEFLYGIHCSMETSKNGRARRNFVWRAVAKAPAGFCHPRGSMVGKLLEDLVKGPTFEVVAAKFRAEMHPLKYRRPTAAPTAGAVDAAEKLVAQLGVEPAFPRRAALVEELKPLWTPAPAAPEAEKGGLFGHLKPQAKPAVSSLTVPPQLTSLDKFRRTVLPLAETIDVYLLNRPQGLGVFTAPVNADAPLLFQWGNPFNWYQWQSGSVPAQMSLPPGWVKVEAVVLAPHLWDDEAAFSHLGAHAFFVTTGQETRSPGAALFPSDLRSELHGISRVVESYSKQAVLQGTDRRHAVGVPVSKGQTGVQVHVRVRTGSVTTEYKIDRWD